MADITITIEGQDYDLDDFDLGDLEWLEDYTGKSLTEPGALESMKTIVGFVYLIKRRDNPMFTVEEARKIKLGQVGPGDEKPEAEGPKRPTRGAKASAT
jgi:hypothetical protein